MIDYGTRKTDLAVKRTEWRLSRVYHQAARDIEDKLKDWQKGHEQREVLYRQQLANGKITQADFDAWMRGQVFQEQQWKARKEQIQKVLLDADRQAAKIVNEGKLSVFADNANYIGWQLEKGAGVNTGFMLYDQNAVARLIKSDPQILPKAAPGVKKDKAYTYYNKLVNSAVTQGIVQGESIPQIAQRIARVTGETSYKSALRNARTAYTGAQNAGRIEGLHQAQELGIKVKKQWMATLDSRTRDAHADLDGQIRDVDEPFDSELGPIDYPGDPTADPANVYNCRCTLVYVYPDYPSNTERRDNETGEVVGDMTYEEWAKSKEAQSYEDWEDTRQDSDFARDTDTRRDMGDIIDTFDIENPIITKRDITDFYQYADATGGMWREEDAGGVHERMTTQTEQALNNLVDKLTGRMNETDVDAQQDYDDIRKWLHETPLYISPQDRANIPDFEDYRRSSANFVRTTLNANTISIDEIYDDLLQSYPGRFRDDVTDVSEKLMAINDGLAQLGESRRRNITDSMSPDELKMLRQDLSDWLVAGFEAAKYRRG